MYAPWLIIGYGSPLHSDDRLGWVVAERLEMMLDAESASVITCSQLTPDLAEPISRAAGVLFIDASAALQPGEVTCTALQPPGMNAPAISGGAFTHHLTPQDLLDTANILYGHTPPGWLYSIGTANFMLGESLSPLVSAVIPEMVSACYERIIMARRADRIPQY